MIPVQKIIFSFIFVSVYDFSARQYIRFYCIHIALEGHNSYRRGLQRRCRCSVYLTPYEHAAEDDLKTVEEIFADDDDGRAAGCPTFTRTYRFDRRSRRRAQEP